MKEILDKIIWYVEYCEVISHRQLMLNLIGEFPTSSQGQLFEALSSAAQDSLIKRIEYKLENQYKYFYLPITAKLP